MFLFLFRSPEEVDMWPEVVCPILLVALTLLVLHLVDRQNELTSRSDFLWRSKLSSEEEGVDTMRGINKILLENILPAHVAEHYLLKVQGVSALDQRDSVSDANIFKQYKVFVHTSVNLNQSSY